MFADKLRKSLLQAAIRGQLTEQLPTDGDARDLLKKIRAEKSKLLAAKKIKAEKPLPPVTADEIPFELPANWCWCRLGEIFTLQAGKFISANEIKSVGKFPCYGGNGIRGFVENYNRDGRFPIIGRQGALCGNINIADGKFYATEHAVVVTLYKNCSPDLAAYFLTALNLNQYATATAQPGLAVGKINNVLFPLPPLAEQLRIVELLTEVDELAKDERELIELQKNFQSRMKKSLLQAAIQGQLTEQLPTDGDARDLLKKIRAEKSKLLAAKKIKAEKPLPPVTADEIPFELPANWCWCRLGDIGTWGAGATPLKGNSAFYENATIPWLVTGDLNDGLITNVPGKISTLALEKTSVKLNPVNSVLVAMYGATIGKIGMLTFPATTNQACCACQTFEGIMPWYLMFFLMFHRKNFIKQGVGGAQPNISKEKIISTLFPLPPLAEQKRIVERLNELLPLCEI